MGGASQVGGASTGGNTEEPRHAPAPHPQDCLLCWEGCLADSEVGPPVQNHPPPPGPHSQTLSPERVTVGRTQSQLGTCHCAMDTCVSPTLSSLF